MIRRTIAVLLIGGSGLAVIGAFGGELHPMLDSFGVGLPYGLLLAVAALAFAGRATRWIAGLLVVLAAIPLTLTVLPAEMPAAPFVLVQHNLRFDRAPFDLTRLDGSDAATLQEVRDPGQLTLPEGWTAHACPFASVGGTVVATPHPVEETGCAHGLAWARIAAPQGEVTVASVHLYWPWPAGDRAQWRQVEAMLPDLRALPRPVLLGGDLNQTSWSATARRVAAAIDARIAPGLRASYADGPLRLRIDHVMIGRGWTGVAMLGPRHGSDHRSLIAHAGPEA